MDVYLEYTRFLALRIHFNHLKYNYIKYNGALKKSVVPEDRLRATEKLCKKYKREFEDFCIANLVANKRIWIHQLLSYEYHEIYMEWKKRKESLTYNFKNDIIRLFDMVDDPNELFCQRDTYPLLLIQRLQNNIQVESFVILNFLMEFVSKWDEFLIDDPIWESERLLILKYEPFLVYDKRTLLKFIKKVANIT
jgi:hypothetical protein